MVTKIVINCRENSWVKGKKTEKYVGMNTSSNYIVKYFGLTWGLHLVNGGMKKADEFRKEKGRITLFSFVNGDYLSCI